jgi:hypothetical protein
MINIETIKKLYYIYFTTFPYDLYNYSSETGNLGMAGISLSFIKAQQLFWFGNIGLIIFIYNIRNIYYWNMIVLLFSLYLYINSFYKVKHYINLI